MVFKHLGVIDPILRALESEGYSTPTDIQQQAIPLILAGRDIMGCAQTGTGKTAAFAVPIIQLLTAAKHSQQPRAIKTLVVTPTRELAIQIYESFVTYGRFTQVRSAVVYGGVKQGAQVVALKRHPDVLIATPGRLLDLYGQGLVSLKQLEHFVLDEADQMLDMGFIHDIKKLLKLLPTRRQSLFFSATMPDSIIDLAHEILYKPSHITIRPQQKVADRVGQSLYYVEKQHKPDLLVHLLRERPVETVLVFARTKHGADKIVRHLKRSQIGAAAIHGNKSQGARQQALSDFKSGKLKVLIATDIAARGIDVDDLSLVINYNLPNVPETYVHRIGRTGRASASGDAISFCEADERICLRDIQRLIKQDIPVIEQHPFLEVVEETVDVRPPVKVQPPNPSRSFAQSQGRRRNNRNRGKATPAKTQH